MISKVSPSACSFPCALAFGVVLALAAASPARADRLVAKGTTLSGTVKALTFRW